MTGPGEIIGEDVLPALNMSVAEAAAKMGVTRQTLHRIIAGQTAITVGRYSGFIDSSGVAKLGGPTFVAWITRKDFADKHPDVIKAFAKVTLDAYADFRKHPEDYKAGTTKAKTIADFNGAKVEEIFDEVDGAYYPLADEQASDAYLGRGTADAIAATAAFLKEQKKVDALLPNYSGTITAEFVKAVAPPSQ